MSTDTAFALGALALVGPRFPDRLRAFMLTVVVVDDLVALVVIATVYTSDLAVMPLLVALGLFGAVILALRWFGRRLGVVYAACGVAIWVALFKSGVDPVVVGSGARAAGVRLPRGAARPGARQRALSPVPRAADARARARGAHGRGVGDLAQRTPRATLSPLDELRHRAAVRPGQRRHRRQRRLHHARLHAARSPWGSWWATSWASRSGIVGASLAGEPAEPGPAAAAGRLGGGGRRRRGGRHRVHRVAAGRGARLSRARSSRTPSSAC